MKLDITVHIHSAADSETLASLLKLVKVIHQKVTKEGVIVMESPEVTAFRERVDAALQSVGSSLSNISADIQRLLEQATGLSAEDKQALLDKATQIEEVAQQVASVAAVVPEP